MEFSDADDPSIPPRRRRPPPRRRRKRPPRAPSGELLKRRAIALAIGLGVLFLLLLAIRGCLDARKERNFENYLRDLSAIVTTSNQLSGEFFSRLENPDTDSIVEFQDQLGSSRGTGEDLLRRAQGLDAPNELDGAQADLVLAFELRRDGLASVAEQIRAALGDDGRSAALERIAQDMREFLASDVLYARAREKMQTVLEAEEISGEVPASVFLTQPDRWLGRLEVASALSQVAATTGEAGTADRGTEISSVVLRPGNVPLTTGTQNTVGRAPTEVEVGVLNGGTVNESDVAVSFQLLGSTDTIQGETTIPRIKAAASRSITLAIDGEIPTGEELTLTVTVLPVPGESVIDNNEASYQLIIGE